MRNRTHSGVQFCRGELLTSMRKKDRWAIQSRGIPEANFLFFIDLLLSRYEPVEVRIRNQIYECSVYQQGERTYCRIFIIRVSLEPATRQPGLHKSHLHENRRQLGLSSHGCSLRSTGSTSSNCCHTWYNTFKTPTTTIASTKQCHVKMLAVDRFLLKLSKI